jgi:hypothetical protein
MTTVVTVIAAAFGITLGVMIRENIRANGIIRTLHRCNADQQDEIAHLERTRANLALNLVDARERLARYHVGAQGMTPVYDVVNADLNGDAPDIYTLKNDQADQ